MSSAAIADLARQVCAGVGSLERHVEMLRRENAILREEILRLGGASAGGEEKLAGAVDYGILSEEQRDTYQNPLISTMSVQIPRVEPSMSVKRRWSRPSNVCLRTLDYFIVCTIVVNMLVAGIEPDAKTAARKYVDIGFTAVFAFEMVIRLYFHGFLKHFVRGVDARWNVYDALLVALGILEVTTDFVKGATEQYSSMLRGVRLAKLFRVVRLVRLPMFHELYHIFRRFSSGMLSLKGSMILLGVTVWCVSVVCTQLIGRDDAPDSQRFPDFQSQRDFLFSDVFKSFFTVFRCINGDTDMLNGDPLVPAFAEAYGMLNLIMALFLESTLRAWDEEDGRLSIGRISSLGVTRQSPAHLTSQMR
eukprot:TRINITY_DN17354_c0_g3_i2.p1 TRINITY_DN17354_c0_g3~~TRINITY_DN17354_c0_g3_i2.p1  ORF type:complete len:362 (+),score=39.13 TRINITY_DN17354_c0_g3_i2:128-1213(+)